MNQEHQSGIRTAMNMVAIWSGVSLAGSGIMGLLREGLGQSLVASLGSLALVLALLSTVAEGAVGRVAVPEVPARHRWGLLVGGCALTAGSYLAVRFGLPFRTLWESLATCGQLLVVVVAAGYLPRFLTHPAELLPLVSVMVCADAVSYLAGPTHDIAREVADYYMSGREGAYPISEVLLMKFPTLGSFDLFPYFGVADWFMVVFLGSASRFFGLADRLAGIPLAVLGLFLASATARLTGLFIPALPVLALFYMVAMILRHKALFLPGRREVLLLLFPPAISLVLLFLKK
jgi:hypothetical protein